MIVEIPDPRNAPDNITKIHWQNARTFVDSLCGSHSPGTSGKVLKAIHVHVVGQLFYDLSHENPASRGKHGMKASCRGRYIRVVEIDKIK